MNNNKYILLEYDENKNYTIKKINNNEEITLSKNNAKIMRKILKNFMHTKASKLGYKYHNYYQILTLFYTKKFLLKLKKKKKKTTVNRKKSRNIKKQNTIIGGAVLLIALGIFCFKNDGKKVPINEPIPIIATQPEEENKNESDNDTTIYKPKTDYKNTLTPTPIHSEPSIEESQSIKTHFPIENEYEVFSFEYPEDRDLTALENAERYRDYFEYYGKMYGIDPNIIALIAAQESSGGINIYGEKATGITQISHAWIYEYGPITVKNYYTGELETVKINSIQELENPETCIMWTARICQYHQNCITNEYPEIIDTNILPLATISSYFWGPSKNAINEATNKSAKEYNYLEDNLKRIGGLQKNTLYSYHKGKTYEITIEITNTKTHSKS